MRSLEWIGKSPTGFRKKLRFIDQTKLPLEEIYITTDNYSEIENAIRRLSIRGAPAIGIAAAYAIVLAIQNYQKDFGSFEDYFRHVINSLKSTRPTAINLFWAIERMTSVFNSCINNSIEDILFKLEEEAIKIHDEDIRMCSAIGIKGSSLIPDKANVLTHCNTGALATGGDGTAFNVIVQAVKQGKKIKVYVDETRPLLQGARLTMWEMKKQGIDATLITDSTATFLMQQNKVDFVIVGADRISSEGFVANKIGTYSLAVSAYHHRIPFYIAAPSSTIDMKIKSGSEIIIETRDPLELVEIFGKRTAPLDVDVYSPAFDVTPPELITAIITDRSVLYPPYSASFHQMYASNK
jgi:methylthioribose-1-phosphate isomerase